MAAAEEATLIREIRRMIINHKERWRGSGIRLQQFVFLVTDLSEGVPPNPTTLEVYGSSPLDDLIIENYQDRIMGDLLPFLEGAGTGSDDRES